MHKREKIAKGHNYEIIALAIYEAGKPYTAKMIMKEFKVGNKSSAHQYLKRIMTMDEYEAETSHIDGSLAITLTKPKKGKLTKAELTRLALFGEARP